MSPGEETEDKKPTQTSNTEPVKKGSKEHKERKHNERSDSAGQKEHKERKHNERSDSAGQKEHKERKQRSGHKEHGERKHSSGHKEDGERKHSSGHKEDGERKHSSGHKEDGERKHSSGHKEHGERKHSSGHKEHGEKSTTAPKEDNEGRRSSGRHKEHKEHRKKSTEEEIRETKKTKGEGAETTVSSPVVDVEETHKHSDSDKKTERKRESQSGHHKSHDKSHKKDHDEKRKSKSVGKKSKKDVEFPSWVKLAPKPTPRQPKPKMEFPEQEVEGEQVGCCGRTRGGHVVEHYHWPQPTFRRRAMSVPDIMRLNEIFPPKTYKRKPHLSVSMPVLPSMETDVDDWLVLDEKFGGFPKVFGNRNMNANQRRRHCSDPSSPKIIYIPHSNEQVFYERNYNENHPSGERSGIQWGSNLDVEPAGGSKSGVKFGGASSQLMFKADIAEPEMQFNLGKRMINWMEDEPDLEEQEFDILRSLSLPIHVKLYDKPPPLPPTMTPGKSISVHNAQFLSEVSPKRKRRIGCGEVTKLGVKPMLKILFPFMPEACVRFPPDDVFLEAWTFLDEEGERQEFLRTMEAKRTRIEKLAKDKFAVDLQRQFLRAAKFIESPHMTKEDRRKAELIILLAIIAHVRSFRGKFMSSR